MVIRIRKVKHQCHVSTVIAAFKRTAMFVCLAASLSLPAVMYWVPNTPAPIDPIVLAQFQLKQLTDTTKVKRSTENSPEWTWICEAHVCQRTSAKNSKILQSLTTCNMMCSNVTLIWPNPTGTVKWSNSTPFAVKSEHFSLKIVKSSSEIVKKTLQQAFELMIKDLSDLERNSHANLNVESKKVIVRVDVRPDPDTKLRLDTDESYKLKLKSKEKNVYVSIKAHSFCGARHAFETLSQLVWFDYYTQSLLILRAASIKDRPKFKYRGLLLDTARNFFPVPDILRTIDAMAASKLNTFHWHATDSQSFPLQLASVPELAKFGAYDTKSVYTREDIKTIVARARVRGIRVIIEIDTPAHVSQSWTYTKLQKTDKSKIAFPCRTPPSAFQLNPLNAEVYHLLEVIYAEIIELTEVTDVFHLGGDEVDEECWFDHHNTSPSQLWMDFTIDAHQALARANNGQAPNLTLIWSSHLVKPSRFDELDRTRFGVQLWGSSEWEDTIDISKAHFRTVMSHVNAWYLDCGLGSWTNDPSSPCDPYKTWRVMYNHRPWSRKRWSVEGGEVCQWTELVSPSNLDTSVWPRASAAAERLWSDPKSPTKAGIKEAFRLDVHRSRLVARGVGAAAIWPQWCSDNPYKCYKDF